MTAAETFVVLQVLAGAVVGWKTDRSGLIILNALFLVTLAILALILTGSENSLVPSSSKLWTFALIVAGFCVPMTVAYYASDRITSAVHVAIQSAPIQHPRLIPLLKTSILSPAGKMIAETSRSIRSLALHYVQLAIRLSSKIGGPSSTSPQR